MQVMIWDDHQGRCIGELNFRTQVICPRQPTCALIGLCSQPSYMAARAPIPSCSVYSQCERRWQKS